MDKDLFAVDRIEETIVVLENIKTKEKREIDREMIPCSIHEGAIVRFHNNGYILDNAEELKRRQDVLERFKNLRKND